MLWIVMTLAAPLPAVRQSLPVASVQQLRVSARVLNGVVVSKASVALQTGKRVRVIREKQSNGPDVEITINDLE